MSIERARYFFRPDLAWTLLFLALCTGHAASAQQGNAIRGTVTDQQTGEPLAGVIVSIPGTRTGTLTKPDGLFVLPWSSSSPATLRFSYIGYDELLVPAEPGREVNVRMKPSTRQLDQVMVTANKSGQELKRLTVSSEIIRPYLITNRNTVNMERLMDQVPGVNVVDGQVNIRGGSGWTFGAGSRVLVMLDDMPYLSGDAGQVQWKFLPTENVEQVEVIKGASSVLYGSSALNGTINIRTSRPGVKPRSGFTSFYGWYDQPPRDSSRWTDRARLQYGFNAWHAQRIRQLDATVSVNYLKDDGYRLGEDDHRFRASFLTDYHVKKIPGLRFGINGSLMDQKSASFLLWDGFPRGAYIALDSQRTNTHATSYSFDPHVDFFTMGVRHRIRGRYLILNNDNTTADTTQNQDNSSYTLYGEYQLQRVFFRELITLTAGYTASYVESDAPLYGGIHTQLNTAPYFQADVRWKRINVVLGVRNESFRVDSAYDNRTIYRAGLNIEVTKSTFFRTSYGEGYRYPSIAERYITTSVGALNIFANPGLEPETGWSAEAGLRQGFRIGNWSGSGDLAYFHTEYSNMVEFNFGIWKAINFLDPFSSLGFKSFNVGRTRIKGWDLSMNAAGSIGKVQLRVLGGMTWMDTKSLDPDRIFAVDSFFNSYSYKFTSTDTSANDLKYRYDKLARADVEIGYGIFYAGVSMRYNSYMKNIDRVFVTLPLSLFVPGIDRAREMNQDGDFIWDVRAGVKITRQLRLSFIVNNLTNHEMMTRPADMRPPRMFMLQMMLQL